MDAQTAKCKDCYYASRFKGNGTTEDDGIFCDYIGHTGHARMLICKAGDGCTVFKPKDKSKKQFREKLKRLFKVRKAEAKEKKDLRKPVIKYDLAWNEICRYESVSAAARELNTSTKNIRQCLQDERKTARGYKWRYAEVVAAD